MKLAKLFVSTVATFAVASVIGIAHAQTSTNAPAGTPTAGAPKNANETAGPGSTGTGGTMNRGSNTTGTSGNLNSGTGSTTGSSGTSGMSSGSVDSTNRDSSTRRSARNRSNDSGSMAGERVARADRN